MERIFQKNTLVARDIGFVQYTTKMALSIAIALGLCMALTSKDDVFISYIMCTLSFFLATWLMAYLFFGGSRTTKIIITAFFIKIAVGLIHYLVFFDSDYFSSSGHQLYNNNEEYQGVLNAITNIANNKIHYGLWYTDLADVRATHPEMMHILSFPFVFFGNNILTISPFNAWCSSIICVSFVCIGNYFLKLPADKMEFLLYVMAFFPFFIISSFFARDTAGLAVMSIGSAMFFLSERVTQKCISLIIALYLFYLHRTIYPVIFFISILSSPLLGGDKKAFFEKFFFVVFFTLLIVIMAESLLPFVFTESDFNMYDATRDMGTDNIIIKVVMFFIGPLWRQINTAPEYSYALQETFVIALMDAFFLALWKCRNNLGATKTNSLMILGFLLLVAGGFNSSAHVPYIAVGVLFLTPFFVDVCDIEVIKNKFRLMASLLIGLNILSLVARFGVF